jgi:DNA ligase-4
MVPFGALVELFERCARESRVVQKRRLLQTFFANYKDDDFFPLMRLLLPQYDRERQTYGMRETAIARLYVEVLGIAERSEDGFRLLHWCRPVTAGAEGSAAGDFGSAVALSLKSRCPERGSLSLLDINDALDRLVAAQDRQGRADVLAKVLRATTNVEQKWFVRIVLKELHLGMNETTVLGFFHKDASELYNMTASLREVCTTLKDPTFALDHSTAMKLFHPVKPMLASRHPPDDVVQVLQGKPFIIETKFDGERIQVHKEGDRVEFYSRQANNVSHMYAQFMADVIRERVNITDCILDGELMVWDDLSGRFEDFGKIKGFVTALRGVDPDLVAAVNRGRQLCYVVFDVIFVKGQPVGELTLEQRTNILRRIVNPKPHVLEIVEQRLAKSSSDVLEALDAAILNRSEGVMLKGLDTPYVPGDRKGKWIKIKPEYLDDVGDSLDLVLIGGYFGKGRRGNNVSHFLVGVQSPGGEITPDGHKIYLSVARVGSGYSDLELGKLQNELREHWRYFGRDPPNWLRTAEGAKDIPDVWIDPKFSRVLQIKAAQIIPSDRHSAGVSLRFPRVERIREDKTAEEATSLKEILQLRE